MPKENGSFTATEVGTLIESFRKELSVVSEGVCSLLSWKETVDEKLGTLDRIEQRIICIEDVIRIVIPSHESRITRLESKLG